MFYFVRSGVVYPYSKYLCDTGYYGRYWSSTPHSNGTSAYRFYFHTGTTVNPSDYNARYYGFSLRCLAR